jgi:hypothetical protein
LTPLPRVAGQKRWRRIALVGLLGLACGTVLVWAWAQWMARRQLEAAIAEADRVDPGWRLADLIAARRFVPAATNSANRVLETAKGIPERWPHVYEPPAESPVREPNEGQESADEPPFQAAEPLLTGADVQDTLWETPPSVALSPELRRALDRALQPVEGAVPMARSLAGADEGRYDFSFGEVAIAPTLPHIEAARRVARLLSLDSARLADAGKIDEALTSARGIIGVARSVGDEPVDLSQHVRLQLRRFARSAILRALGQGEASDAVLAAVQDDLAHEAAHDLLLCAMRAQRAAYFDTLGKMADGAYARFAEGDFAFADSLGARDGRALVSPVAQALYMRAYGIYNQALALSIANQAVEGAKFRPFDPGWFEHWKAHEQALETPGPIQRRLGATAYIILPLNSTMLWLSYDSQALFAATRVLLAAERYRRSVGRWPERLDDVVPAYLREIPRGPYSDQPVRFVHKGDGVIAYAVGLKGEDNGGRLNPQRKREPKFDVGEHLWNPELRRRPRQSG